MKFIKYFFQSLFIFFLLIIFRLIGLRLSRILASKIFITLGPFFRSKKICNKNISLVFSQSDEIFKKKTN